ncbi:hypothetical protein OF83DRAFT_763842 [Amylostereum chailletii]|nr:hypothetical protein OF83DRAFT_763842 [Amylostereum chailletii]
MRTSTYVRKKKSARARTYIRPRPRNLFIPARCADRIGARTWDSCLGEEKKKRMDPENHGRVVRTCGAEGTSQWAGERGGGGGKCVSPKRDLLIPYLRNALAPAPERSLHSLKGGGESSKPPVLASPQLRYMRTRRPPPATPPSLPPHSPQTIPHLPAKKLDLPLCSACPCLSPPPLPLPLAPSRTHPRRTQRHTTAVPGHFDGDHDGTGLGPWAHTTRGKRYSPSGVRASIEIGRGRECEGKRSRGTREGSSLRHIRARDISFSLFFFLLLRCLAREEGRETKG